MLARTLTAIGLLWAATTPTLAQISDDIVKIGVLTDMKGTGSTRPVRAR